MELHIPHAGTVAAMEEVEEMKKNSSEYKSYTEVDEMMGELLGERIMNCKNKVCKKNVGVEKYYD